MATSRKGFRDHFVGEEPLRPGQLSKGITPTDEQEAALEVFRSGESYAIEAGAGTGKTSTLILVSRVGPRNLRGQYVAFNKSIVVDAGRRLPGNVRANTAHSLAFREVGRAFQHRLDSSQRMRSSELAQRLGVTSIQFNVGGSPKTLTPSYLASLTMRTVDRFCQTAHPDPSPRHVPYVEGIDEFDQETQRRGWRNNEAVSDHLMPFVAKAWSDVQSREGHFPYKHNYYLKAWQLGSPRLHCDFILFDEVQDSDPVMADVVLRQADEGVQVVLVGDSQQEVYGWRGALNAFELFGMEHTIFLTQTFRFGEPIAELANRILADLEAPLRLRGYDRVESRIRDVPEAEADAILCRTNATAVRTVLRLQNERRPVALVGGGKEVLTFARAVNDLTMRGFTSHPDLACFRSYSEVQEYVRDDPQGSDLRLMVELVDQFGTEVIEEALGSGRIASESVEGAVTVSTAHRAKGREWSKVKLAGDFALRTSKSGDVLAATAEEQRLLYVAVTRAKHVLDPGAVPQLRDR